MVCMLLFFMQSKSVERPTHSIKGTAYIVFKNLHGQVQGWPRGPQSSPFWGVKDYCSPHGLVKSHSIGASHIHFTLIGYYTQTKLGGPLG